MKKGITKSQAYQKHPSSYVSKNCRIGHGTKIWHFCNIMDGAVLGNDCVIGQNVFIAKDVLVGHGVKIQNNVSIYSGVELHDNVFCGPSCVFTNVRTPRSHVSRKDEYAKTIVGQGATIGANATIVCGNSIGRYSFIGAGSCVTKNVPDYALVYGVPAKVRGWVCECGEVLKFKGKSVCCKRCNCRYLKTRNAIQKQL